MMPREKYKPPRIIRGAIAWLPGQRYLKVQLPDIPPDVFDHPVVIYAIPEPGSVDVFLITSFHKGCSLSGKFKHDAAFRARQLPLYPAPPHQDNGILLAMDDGRVWPRSSYVSLSSVRVPVVALREETQGPWQLTADSLEALDKVVGSLPNLPVARTAVAARDAGLPALQIGGAINGVNDVNDVKDVNDNNDANDNGEKDVKPVTFADVVKRSAVGKPLKPATAATSGKHSDEGS